jgi:hypothetical protein
MLSKLAYLTLCRSIQLLVLLARGDAAQELEILVLRHQLTVLRRQTPRPARARRPRLLAAVSRVLPRSRWSVSSSGRRRCCAGTGSWSRAHGPTHIVEQGVHHWTRRCSNSGSEGH